jgi:hypothetical protein
LSGSSNGSLSMDSSWRTGTRFWQCMDTLRTTAARPVCEADPVPGTLGSQGAWSGRRVLVTGATGIIGSHLVAELLALGAYVVALVRDTDPQSELIHSGNLARVAVINGLLEDFWTVERAISLHETDTVVHPVPRPSSAWRTGCRFTFEPTFGAPTTSWSLSLHSGLVGGWWLRRATRPTARRKPCLTGRRCRWRASILRGLQELHGPARLLPTITPTDFRSLARCGNVYGGDLN